MQTAQTYTRLDSLNTLDLVTEFSKDEGRGVKIIFNKTKPATPAFTQLNKLDTLITPLAAKFEPITRPSPLKKEPSINPVDFSSSYSFSSKIESIVEPIFSYSSTWTMNLLSWRNTSTNIVKKVATEMALPLLTFSSVIETVAYNAIMVAAVFYPSSACRLKILQYVKSHAIIERSESSAFTISWTVKLLFQNMQQATVVASETDARKKV